MYINFAGIGFATTIIVFLLNCYYNVILAWAFRYLFASFTAELPWSNCNNEWNTESCVVRNIMPINATNNTGDGNFTKIITTDPVTEYWE